mgnify:FL=1
MINKLPAKLVLLRKHFGYSQQDVAERLGITTQAYMEYENGSAMMNTEQFRILAALFHVSMDTMLINDDDIQLPDISDRSVEIPFVKREQPSRDEPMTEEEFLNSLRREDEEEDEEGLQRTMTHRIVDNPTKEANLKNIKEADDGNSKIRKIGIIAGIVFLAILAGVIFLLSRSRPVDLSIGDVNRLVAADRFSAYLDRNGKERVLGESISTGDFKNVVQISGRSNFLVGLKKDGTVVCSINNDACKVSDWSKITRIAAGRDHTLGLKNDGTVVCSGNAQACEVSDWSNVKAIYAGDGLSLGITEDGNVLAAGNCSQLEAIRSLQKVKSLAVGTKELVVLNEDETCKTLSLGGDNVSYVGSWTNIKAVAVYNEGVVGLQANGQVVATMANTDLLKELENWTNIAYLAGNQNYLIGVDHNGIMYGIGDNSNHVYTNPEPVVTPTPTPEEEQKTKLAPITWVQFDVDQYKLGMSWNAIENADYYQVTMSIGKGYTVKTKTNSLSIEAGKLTENSTYSVSVTAFSNSDKYTASDAYSTTYRYVAATPTPTPTPDVTVGPEKRTLTIEYVYEDGRTAASPVQYEMEVGKEYTIESPKLNGYTPSSEIVKGIMQDNVKVTVIYKATATPTPSVEPTPTPTATATATPPTPTPSDEGEE